MPACHPVEKPLVKGGGKMLKCICQVFLNQAVFLVCELSVCSLRLRFFFFFFSPLIICVPALSYVQSQTPPPKVFQRHFKLRNPLI